MLLLMNKSIRDNNILSSKGDLCKYVLSEREYIQSMQIIGTRNYQEDEYFIKIIPKHIIIAGIFDGHGGGSCSKWVSKMFQRIILKTLDMLHNSSYKVLINIMLSNSKERNQKNYIKLIQLLNANSISLNDIIKENISIFSKLKKINNFLYEDLLKKTINKISMEWDKISIPKIKNTRNKYTCGTTVLISLIVGHTVHILWIGDSRTVWKIDNNKSVFSTKDHKPNIEDLLPGAFIENKRINGVLAVGRAIGDNGTKTVGALKRTPSYINFNFKKKIEIIMGSDGVYDKINSNHIVFDPEFEQKIIKQKEKQEKFFTDNTTFIKIKLDKSLYIK